MQELILAWTQRICTPVGQMQADDLGSFSGVVVRTGARAVDGDDVKSRVRSVVAARRRRDMKMPAN